MTTKLDTHYYDGHIMNYAQMLLDKIRTTNCTFEQSIQSLKEWSIKLDYPHAISSLQLIEQEQGEKNLDPTDHIHVEHLITLIWDKIKEEPQEYLYVFEQLSDIVLYGPCVMGRVKRLFQVVKSLYD